MLDQNYMRLRCAEKFKFPSLSEPVKSKHGGKRLGAGRKAIAQNNFAGILLGPEKPKVCKCGIRHYTAGTGNRSLCVVCSVKSKARKAGYCAHEKPLLKNGASRQLCLDCLPKPEVKPRRLATRSSRSCIRCRAEFMAALPSAKYCSAQCRTDVGNNLASVKSLEKNRKPRKCPGCGVEFCGIDNVMKSHYCEPLCRNRHLDAKRLANNPLHALKSRIRSLIYNTLRKHGYKKESRTQEVLGCTVSEFKTHIERQFLPGMSWRLRGAIHIDHIVPSSSAKNERELLALNHFTNLRPLWAADNVSKRDTITHLI